MLLRGEKITQNTFYGIEWSDNDDRLKVVGNETLRKTFELCEFDIFRFPSCTKQHIIANSSLSLAFLIF